MKNKQKLFLFLFALLVIVQFISFVPAPALCEPPNTEIFTCSGMYDKTVYDEPYIATYIGSCPGLTEAEGGGSAAINCLGNPTFCHVGNEYSCSLTQYIVSTSCSGLSESACSSKYPDCTGSTECVPDEQAPQECSVPEVFDSCSGFYETQAGDYSCTGDYEEVSFGDKLSWDGTTYGDNSNWNVGQTYSDDGYGRDTEYRCRDYYVSSCSWGSCDWTYDQRSVNPGDLFDPYLCGGTVTQYGLNGGRAREANIVVPLDCALATDQGGDSLDEEACLRDQYYAGCEWTQGTSSVSCIGLNEATCIANGCTVNKICPSEEETCFDGDQNQGETGIDCGGPCPACADVVDTTTCEDDEEGNDPLVMGTSYLTENWIIAEPDITPYTDSCTGGTLTEYSCEGPVGDESILIEPYPCPNGCGIGVCLPPEVPSVYWSALADKEVLLGDTYTASLILSNPGAITTTDFKIYERDAGGLDGESDLVGTVTATLDSGSLVAYYGFTTAILNTINDEGVDGPNFDFYFVAEGFGGIISEDYSIYINETKSGSDSCPTEGDGTPPYQDKYCDVALLETTPLCPKDCFTKGDGICSDGSENPAYDAGENHENSPIEDGGDCSLTAEKKIAWLYYVPSSYPSYQEIVNDVYLDINEIDHAKFKMAYMTSSPSSSVSFILQIKNSAGVYEDIGTPFATTPDSEGDIVRVWYPKYSEFWGSTGFDKTQKTYDFKFTIDGITSIPLRIKLTGNGDFPDCNDGIKNGAEECVDGKGECPYNELGDSTCIGDEDVPYCSQAPYPPVVCSHYVSQNDCDSNICNLGSAGGSVCYWDISTGCNPKDEGLAGTCYYSEKAVNEDDCTDGYYSYSYDTNFEWKEWVKEGNHPLVWTTGYVEDERDGIFYFDPEGEYDKCQPGQETIACPAQIKLSFWTWQNIIATVALIFLGYYILDSRKKKVVKKKVVKKKVVKKKAVKKKVVKSHRDDLAKARPKSKK